MGSPGPRGWRVWWWVGTPIFHLYVGLTHFLGFNIFWGFLKNEYFGGMKKLWIFLGGHYKTRLFLGDHYKTRLFLGVISIHFRAIRSIYRTGIFFWVAKISNIFGG